MLGADLALLPGNVLFVLQFPLGAYVSTMQVIGKLPLEQVGSFKRKPIVTFPFQSFLFNEV